MTKKNEFTRPAAPNPPLFINAPERNFVKQVNTEVIERIIGNRILYYSVDFENTEYNFYGEAINKTFLPPVMVFVLLDFGSTYKETKVDHFGLEKDTHMIVHFHKRRLSEEINLYAREGDFLLFNQTVYEIVKLTEPTSPFGQPDFTIDISATCVKSRKGLFNAQ